MRLLFSSSINGQTKAIISSGKNWEIFSNDIEILNKF